MKHPRSTFLPSRRDTQGPSAPEESGRAEGGIERFGQAWLQRFPEYGNRLVVAVGGTVDYQVRMALRDRLHTHTGMGQGDAVLDLTRVEFLDAYGTGAVIALHNRLCDQRRRLYIAAAPTGPVLRILCITGLTTILRLRDDLPGALIAAGIGPAAEVSPLRSAFARLTGRAT
ncbi:STAS domain-containing protein [Streptomyces sp. NBC_00690]|uniref:STAS domain-containing protein n=1 Tax=Streptomyces sp. NBC_00690 TaxID=2975808 RepID=UPI002E2DF6D8|nr:STAS domain-containing protein [Streptomyces sp. NBC_00690]